MNMIMFRMVLATFFISLISSVLLSLSILPQRMDMNRNKSNRFQNPGLRQGNQFSGLLKWQFNRIGKVPSFSSARDLFPVIEPKWDIINSKPNELTITWVGHSTLLVQIEGLTILTDPIFSERCSPSQLFGPRRFTPVPFPPEALPAIDAVVISHNHYDHLDEATVKALGNQPVWFVPRGVKRWFVKRGITNVIEMDWWQEYQLGRVTIVCTPSQHFSGRSPFDRNRTLWSSWAIIGTEQRFWFAGDTGHSPLFSEVGIKYGPFDLAAIPIGSYGPEWFMLPIHVNPAQAIQVHKDVRARQSVGIHYGTFILSDEPVTEPVELLKEEREKAGMRESEFFTIQHGETRIIKNNKETG